jgi:16S rRNA (cytidine1402-2'-O)-methyltransferase
MSAPSKVYLIPVPIAPEAWHTLSPEVIEITKTLQHYFVENARTARRTLRALHPALVIESLQISELEKTKGFDVKLFKQWLKKGVDIGIMSESGCPGVADPGAELVQWAHQAGASVLPLVGPSSVLLALMGSGLQGQSFTFWGYLPIKQPARSRKIKELEEQSLKNVQTQIVIETPYRNNNLLAELLQNLTDVSLLCIACNLTSLEALLQTKTVKEWKRAIPELPKEPCIFLYQKLA